MDKHSGTGLTAPERRERVQIGRIGAHALHAKRDGAETTKAARATATAVLDERLLGEVDPDHALTERERGRRLAHARSAHFGLLSLKAHQARYGRNGKASE